MSESLHGGIHGQVVYRDNGKPLESAAVVVVQGGPSPDIAPLTDSEGWFTLDMLPEGEWLIRAHGSNGELGEATVKVSAGSVTPVVIQAK
jgi:hypothetical protein